jgi:hypothetical protein
MPLRVLKPFNSTLQRFRAGDDIADGADLSPHTAASLTAAGFLSEPAPPAVQKPARAFAAPASED